MRALPVNFQTVPLPRYHYPDRGESTTPSICEPRLPLSPETGGAQGALRGGRPTLPSTMETAMAAFVGGPWGKRVYVRDYLRCKNGKWESVNSHFRNWPRH